MSIKIAKFNLFLQEAIMFVASLLLGVWVATRLREAIISQELELPSFSAGTIFLYVIFGTIFILILTKLSRRFKGVSYRVIFAIVIFGGLNIFFSTFLAPAVALFLAFALTVYRMARPTIINHNLAIILSVAGIGGTLGLSLTPLGVIILLVILSVYDFIAVYKTKHMVRLAKEMIESQAILGFIIPEHWVGHREHISKAQPGQGFMFLGGGDVVIPTLFAVSVLPSGVLVSIIVVGFALLGLLADHYFFTHQAMRRAIPALPLIAGFSIVGYGLYRLVDFLV